MCLWKSIKKNLDTKITNKIIKNTNINLTKKQIVTDKIIDNQDFNSVFSTKYDLSPLEGKIISHISWGKCEILNVKSSESLLGLIRIVDSNDEKTCMLSLKYFPDLKQYLNLIKGNLPELFFSGLESIQYNPTKIDQSSNFLFKYNYGYYGPHGERAYRKVRDLKFADQRFSKWGR